MVAGTIVAALIGGAAGVVFSSAHNLGLLHSMFSYQLGGFLAVAAFLALMQSSSLVQNDDCK